MKTEFYSDETKCKYKAKLVETIGVFENLLKETHLPIYENVVNQLLDIKEMVVEKQIIFESFDIDERYTLGAIAIRYFDENKKLQDILCDIYYGALHFSEFPE